MTVHMTPAILEALYKAVNEVDAMMVAEQRHNDCERTERKGGDVQRLARYDARRKLHLAHRENLQAIYVAITNSDPWQDIAY